VQSQPPALELLQEGRAAVATCAPPRATHHPSFWDRGDPQVRTSREKRSRPKKAGRTRVNVASGSLHTALPSGAQSAERRLDLRRSVTAGGACDAFTLRGELFVGHSVFVSLSFVTA
jgi:hypothetical protein